MIIETSTQYPKMRLTDKLDLVLHRPARELTLEECKSRETVELFREMEKLCSVVGGVGLAAQQLGVDASMALILSDKGFIRACNPKIEQRSRKLLKSKEGCLTLPYEDWTVNRHAEVRVTYTDTHGKRCFREAKGFEAVIWQHEIAHIAGHLISEGEQVEETQKRH